MTDYKQLYERNAAFHLYVDREMIMYGRTLEDVLQMKTVQDVGDYYATRGEDPWPGSGSTHMTVGGC